MKKLIIMRGLPGSGKSRRADELRREFISVWAGTKQTAVCSADDFFVGADGVYAFDPTRIGQAHTECQTKALLAMFAGTPLVIIDNTNTQRWESQLYLSMAGLFGYKVQVETVGNREDVRLYAQRNTHGVPLEAIQSMADRWEDCRFYS